jgi:hypothetical protein
MIRYRSIVFGGFVFFSSLFIMPVPGEIMSLSLVTPLLQSIPVPANFPVEQFLAHWWVFPVSILFAMVALASGVSGALFFSPFFMLLRCAAFPSASFIGEFRGFGRRLAIWGVLEPSHRRFTSSQRPT